MQSPQEKALHSKKDGKKSLKKKIHSLNPAALDSRMKGYKNNKH